MMRRERDYYPTPQGVVEQVPDVLDHFQPFLPSLIVDLGAGDGRLGRAAAEYAGCTWRGFDIEPVEGSGVERHDVLLGPYPLCPRADLVISNPPFKHALNFTKVALSISPRCAMLLPLAFLASRGRKAFWETAPLWRVLILSARPSFTSDGKTDSKDLAWFLFDRSAPARTIAWI